MGRTQTENDIHEIAVQLKRLVNIIDRRVAIEPKPRTRTYNDDEIKQLRIALGLPDSDDDLK